MNVRKIAYLVEIGTCIICCVGCNKSNSESQHSKTKSLQLDINSFDETTTMQAITTTQNQTSTVQTTQTTSRTTTSTCLTTEYVETTITEQIEQLTESVQQENIEPETEVESNVYIPDDCIIIHDVIIPLVHLPAYQSNVDANDVVQDANLYDNAVNKILLFGHVNKSFGILNSVCTDEVITLVNSGEPKEYVVRRSELGVVNDSNTDIILADGERTVLYTDMGYPELVLITCADETVNRYRWVVIATEME